MSMNSALVQTTHSTDAQLAGTMDASLMRSAHPSDSAKAFAEHFNEGAQVHDSAALSM